MEKCNSCYLRYNAQRMNEKCWNDSLSWHLMQCQCSIVNHWYIPSFSLSRSISSVCVDCKSCNRTNSPLLHHSVRFGVIALSIFFPIASFPRSALFRYPKMEHIDSLILKRSRAFASWLMQNILPTNELESLPIWILVASINGWPFKEVDTGRRVFPIACNKQVLAYTRIWFNQYLKHSSWHDIYIAILWKITV